MRVLRIASLLAFAFASQLAHAATTYFVGPNSNLQSVISGTVAGDTVSFQLGDFFISSALTMKCGVTYTGPVVPLQANGLAVPTAILHSNGGNIFNFFGTSGCANTVVQFLNFSGAAEGVYIQGPTSNVTVTHNAFTSIPLQGSNTTGAMLVDAPSQGAVPANLTISWNQIGDINSCPGQFTIENSAACSGINTFASLNGFFILHNNFFHIGEAVHIQCPNYANQQFACEPPGGPITKNVVGQYNDFNQIHRITWEQQPQQAALVNFSYNSEHDWLGADEGSFGLSMACCSNGTANAGGNPPTVPVMTTTNNLVMFNAPYRGAPGSPFPNTGGSRYGYGFEAMGKESTYSHNMLQSAVFPNYAQGIAHGNGGGDNFPNYPPDSSFDFTFNYICGTWEGYPNNLSAYISSEGTVLSDYHPPTTGSNFQTSCGSTVSAAPTISPASGTYASPLPITLTDAGFSTGAVALGNTSIWYTTDGTTPVPGSGTAKFYSGPFSVSLPVTVKAVGMWGAQNQPTSYASGFGFTPSAVVTANYSASGTAVTLSSITLSCPSTTLTAGASAQSCSLSCNYTDGSHPDCTNAADSRGNGPGIYASNQPTIASISSGAVVTPLVAGSANLTATVGVLTSTLPVSVTASGGGGMSGAVFLGNNQENFTGITYQNAFNSVYSISPPYTTTVGNCHFFLPTDTITSGAHYDCLIIAAPTPTTEASTAICKGTYTTSSSVAPNAFVTVPMTGCGTIAASTPYWVAGITDDTSAPAYGFWDCGGTCGTTAPTTYGTGTYQSRWAAVTYGSYTSLPSSLNFNSYQVSQYVDLVPTGAALTGGYQDNTLSVSKMVLGSGFVLHAYCVYNDGIILQCDTTDARGNAVTAWTEDSSGTVVTIGAVGSGHPGLVTGVGYGQTNTHCTLTGGIPCNKFTWTVTNQPATVTPIQGMTLHGMSVN